jgi:GntR family transcriptional regulator, transcriptional repressor for pyruvate dehydrogenase complex
MANSEMTVIAFIRDQIVSDDLKPGDKLPSERELCETLKVSRGYIRKALAKLNHIGLIETLPQKGTLVAGFSSKAISGLLSSIGNFDGSFEPFDLFEIRSNLEMFSARQAARKAGKAELEAIQSWHAALRLKVESGIRALEEDHLFHLAIAKASANAVCFALICYITPQILSLTAKPEAGSGGSLLHTYEEHERIVRAILAGDPDGAEAAMRKHMEEAWRRRSPDYSPGLS